MVRKIRFHGRFDFSGISFALGVGAFLLVEDMMDLGVLGAARVAGSEGFGC